MSLKSILNAIRTRIKRAVAPNPPPAPTPRMVIGGVYIGVISKDGTVSDLVKFADKIGFVSEQGKIVSVRRDGIAEGFIWTEPSRQWSKQEDRYSTDGLDGPE